MKEKKDTEGGDDDDDDEDDDEDKDEDEAPELTNETEVSIII